MQSLYSYMSSKTNKISFIENAMLKHFDDVVELKLVIVSLLVEIVKYADGFYEDGKKKLKTFAGVETGKKLNPLLS